MGSYSGYYILRNEISDIQRTIIGQTDSWLRQLAVLRSKLNIVASDSTLTGKSADSIKAYISEEPIVIIDRLCSAVSAYRDKLFLYAYGYSSIDSDSAACLHEETIDDYRDFLKRARADFDENRTAANNALAAVSDIFESPVSLPRLYTAMQGLQGQIQNFDRKIENYEISHRHDTDNIDSVLNSLAALMGVSCSRPYTDVISYTIGSAIGADILKSIDDALLSVQSELDTGNARLLLERAKMEYAVCQISEDYQSIIYDGESYPIIVPDYTGTEQYISGSVWETVKVIEISDTDFNYLKAISRFSIGGDTNPADNPYGVNKNIPNNYVNLFKSIVGFLDSGFDYSRIVVILERDSAGNTRAIIGYSTRSLDKYFSNVNYGSYISQYNSVDTSLQHYVSEGVSNAYEKVSGEELPPGNYGYVYSWDERHKESNVQGFIYFDEQGNMYKQFLVFGEDNVIISDHDIFGVPTEEIADVTEYLSVPERMSDEEQELFIEMIETGGN